MRGRPVAVCNRPSGLALEKSPLSLDAAHRLLFGHVWRGRCWTDTPWRSQCDRDLRRARIRCVFREVLGELGLIPRSTKAKATRTGGGINVFNFTPSYARAVGHGMSPSATSFTRFRQRLSKHSNSTYELFTTVA
jgi:hypothetical protein